MSSSGKTVDTRVTGSCVWRLVSCSESFFFFFFSFSSFHSEQQHPSFVSFRFFNFQWHSVWPLLWGAWTDGKLFSNRFSFSFVPSSTDISAPLCSRITHPRCNLETSPPPSSAVPHLKVPFLFPFFLFSFSILFLFFLFFSEYHPSPPGSISISISSTFSPLLENPDHMVSLCRFSCGQTKVPTKRLFWSPHFLACHS